MRPIKMVSRVTFVIIVYTGVGFAASTASTRASQAYGRLGLTFEANRGQMDKDIRFASRTQGLGIALKADEALFGSSAADAVHMRLIGRTRNAHFEGLDLQQKRTNYLTGADPRNWRTDVANYGRVRYAEVWPGIDLIFYGNQQQLEYDLIIAPGADPASIQIAFDGARDLKLDPGGNLIIDTPAGKFCQIKPKTYQEKQGRRMEIDGRYVLGAHHRVSFQLGAYDKRSSVVVDPMFMRYSTFVGGQNSAVDLVNIVSIAVDGGNNAYITGRAQNFPGLGANTQGVFVAKLNPSGTSLLYQTYIGGTAQGGTGANLSASGIAVDPSGNAYVTGFVINPGGFPGSPMRFPPNLPDSKTNTFALKLNAAGNTMLYSVLMGGLTGNNDQSVGLALDSSLNAYILGVTNSTDFPNAAGHFQQTLSGSSDAFIAKLNPSGVLLASTYFGGSLDEIPGAIAVDSTPNVYIAGSTRSLDFPTTNAATFGAPLVSGDQGNFVAKLSGDLNTRAYSRIISGGESSGHGLAVDRFGNTYVVGSTSTPSYPATNGFAPVTSPPRFMAYLTKLDPPGSAVLYSTGIGGVRDPGGVDARNIAFGVAVDASGNAYVTGYTNSPTFPVTSTAFQSTFGGPATSNTSNNDAFYTKIDTTRTGAASLVYSTYLGGRGLDEGLALALDNSQSVYIAGVTGNVVLSTGGAGSQTDNFPVTSGAFQTAGPNANTVAGFVTRFAPPDKAAIFRDGFWAVDRDNNGVFEPPPRDVASYFGQAGDIPLRGDWNGDGRIKIGIFRNGLWALDLDGDGQFVNGVDAGFYFGQAGDIPVVGDWNGDGRSKVGIFRNGAWALDLNGNRQFDLGSDPQFFFGSPNDTPVVGDWNGDGRTKVGIFRSSVGAWALDFNGNNQFDSGVDPGFYFGSPGDVPVIGDWNGNGRSKVGIFRNGIWALDTNGNNQLDGGDAQFFYGQGSDFPVVGDWSGNGVTKVGIVRMGFWSLDLNGNNQFDGGGDRIFYYGAPNDKFVSGQW